MLYCAWDTTQRLFHGGTRKHSQQQGGKDVLCSNWARTVVTRRFLNQTRNSERQRLTLGSALISAYSCLCSTSVDTSMEPMASETRCLFAENSFVIDTLERRLRKGVSSLQSRKEPSIRLE